MKAIQILRIVAVVHVMLTGLCAVTAYANTNRLGEM